MIRAHGHDYHDRQRQQRHVTLEGFDARVIRRVADGRQRDHLHRLGERRLLRYQGDDWQGQAEGATDDLQLLKFAHSVLGGGVLAVPTHQRRGGKSAVYLMEASNGTILRTINYSGPIFAQPVFADDELIVAGPTLQAYVP